MKQVDEYEDEILLLRRKNGNSAKIEQVQAELEMNAIDGQEPDVRVEVIVQIEDLQDHNHMLQQSQSK